MMSNVHPSVSCLEQLPNELWLLILTYLSPGDRLRAFGNLNYRLNVVLYEGGAGIDDSIARYSCQLDELSPCVSTIVLQRRAEMLYLNNFPKVRALIMLDIMRHQILAIDSIYTPYLTVLHLSSSNNTLDACYGRLLEFILNENFPSLVSMRLPQAHFFGFCKGIGHSGLRYVTIGTCHSIRFANLISLIPNAISLEIRHLISWPIRQTVNHKNIRYLTFCIDSHSDTMHDIDSLKSSISSLKDVRIMELDGKMSRCVPISQYDTVIDDANEYDDDDDDDD